MQIELGTTIADDFIRLNVEAEMALRQMMGSDYKFQGSEAAESLIRPAIEKRLKKDDKKAILD